MMKRVLPSRSKWSLRLFLVSLLLIASLSCGKLPRLKIDASGQTAPLTSQTGVARSPLININTASHQELEKLPGIGRGLAERIVAHRDEYGRFRRPEHLMMVRGISARRFNAMRALIVAE